MNEQQCFPSENGERERRLAAECGERESERFIGAEGKVSEGKRRKGEMDAMGRSVGAGITTHNGISEISPLPLAALAPFPLLLRIRSLAASFPPARQTYCSTNEIVHLVSSPLQCRTAIAWYVRCAFGYMRWGEVSLKMNQKHEIDCFFGE